MKCRFCGAELEQDARFCHMCGRAVPPVGGACSYCSHCGTKLPPMAAYCPHCGAALRPNRAEPKPEIAPAVKAEPVAEPAPSVKAEPKPVPAKPAPAPEAKKEPRPEIAPEKPPEPELPKLMSENDAAQKKPSVSEQPELPPEKPAAQKKPGKKKEESGGGTLVLVLLIVALIFGSVCAFLYVKAYTRGQSVGEYLSSGVKADSAETTARWSDLKAEATPTEAPTEAAEEIQPMPDGIVTKDVCAMYLEILQGRRELIEAYDWQQKAGEVSKQVVFCDICGDNLPELVWVERAPEENVTGATLQIAGIRDGKPALLYSESWDIQAGGGFHYYLFQEHNSKTLYSFTAAGEETWTECWSSFADRDTALEREELLKSVVTTVYEGENTQEERSYTKTGAITGADEYAAAVESLRAGTKTVLMYNANAGSFALDYVAQHGSPVMSCGEAIAFLTECLAAIS